MNRNNRRGFRPKEKSQEYRRLTIAMPQPAWKRLLSYFADIHLESASTDLNPSLELCLRKGRYCLTTPNAIYSYGDLYDNFTRTFKQIRLDEMTIQDVLILGFGLGSVPFMLEKVFNKNYRYTGVEKDQVIARWAEKYVLPELQSHIELEVTDADFFLKNCSRQFDLIVMDIFVDDVVPPEFEESGFLIALNKQLNKDGLLLYNRLAQHPGDRQLITYRMLLAHTSSISDDFQNTLDLDCYGIDCSMSLAQFFDNVFTSNGAYFSSGNFSNNPPGSTEDYSNLGSALAGYLVERIAQTPFDVYCKNNIFVPLGMYKTEWRLSNTPIAELAIPYSPDITSPNPHYTFPDYPNGGLRTNVLDLSRFLRAIIQNGIYNGFQLLSPSSMATMKTLQFGSSEQCLSFYYDTINGRKVLGHSGGEKGVTTEMYYDPTTNIGVIVLNNDDDAYLEDIVTLLFNYGEKF